MRIVVALGGNALQPRDGPATLAEQRAHVREACVDLATIVADGTEVVVTHGNGPQVGRLMILEETTASRFTPYPLDVLVAETQGQIGYLVQQELSAALRRQGTPRTVVTLVTTVEVDPADPALLVPAKPVGPEFGAERAAEYRGRGERLVEVGPGRWRRLVPSPSPRTIVEAPAIRALLGVGFVPIVAGGGGVPVVREGNATRGIGAVVDKDRTAAVLVRELRADALLILTDVDGVATGWGTPQERFHGRLSVAEATQRLEAGEFPPGSMGPKVTAAVEAVASGARALIGPLARARDVLRGEAGTEVTP